MNTAISRSSFRAGHALITPESHVPLSFPDREKCLTVYFITPQLGAAFSNYMTIFEKGGSYKKKLNTTEILGYVLNGSLNLALGGNQSLRQGSFFFLPPGSDLNLTANEESRVLYFEKVYKKAGIAVPAAFVSHERDLAKEEFLGDPGALLQHLLPDNVAFDMAVNIFEFVPGGTLPNVETHYMEHGLYVLQGQGVYRLGESWYPVQKDDAIWMGPFCLQWFCATGKENAKYIYYKDVNRDPAE
ncbi:MAG: (S)-ureidoglycine aminohydrolase [Leptospirales bacterium]|nr:(S)-ureidoglycine aminohydrolase [Leptospirales bacterium]